MYRAGGKKMNLTRGAALIVALLTVYPAAAQLTEQNPEELQKIGVDEHYGESISLDLPLIDEKGDSVRLGDAFREGKPVALTLFYSDCPMLCSLVLNGLQKAVREVEYRPGIDYRLVSVSIDPKEKPERGLAGRERFSEGLPDGTPQDAWSFFTANDSTIARLTGELGFRYFYDEKQAQYAHPAVVFILTPDGRISRYLYGIEFKPNDLRLALLEASSGAIGTTLDRIILYCYHYDPNARGYVVLADRVMRLGGGLTLGMLGMLLGGLWVRDLKKYRK